MKIALIIAAIIALFCLFGMIKEANKHGIHRLTWRWFSGNPWHGKPITNSTWTRRATKVHNDSGTALKWHHLPRMHRAGIRTSGTILIIAIVIGMLKDRGLTIRGLMSTGSLLLIIITIMLVRSLRKWHTDKVVATPLAMALSPQLGIPEKETQKALTIASNALTIKRGEIGRIVLPPQFAANPKQRDGIEHLVDSRMPVDVDFKWFTTRNPQYLSLLAAPKPPTMVGFTSLIEAMEACKPGQIVLGIDRKGEIFYGSFNTDDPHWGFSVGTGRGKSTMLQATAAQILHNDSKAKLFGIDPKLTSLDPLIGIPGVIIACNPLNIAEMWSTIAMVKAEMMTRLEIQKKDPTVEFPMNLLLIDEINTFNAMSRVYWAGIEVGQPYGVGDLVKPPKTNVPPVWTDIAYSLWMGRVTNTHLITVGQRLDDRSTGGIGLRDSLGLRGLAGFRKNQWDMLVGTTPVPKSKKPKGRWIYSDGESETWVQNVFGDASTIRDYAMANRIASADKIDHIIPEQRNEFKPRIEIIKP